MLKPSKKVYAFLGIILTLLIVLHYIGWLSFIERSVRALTFPVLKSSRALNVQVGESYHFFRDRDAFLTSYATCSAALEDQSVLKTRAELLAQENGELKKLLEFKQKQQKAMIVAEVVGKEIGNTDQIIIINKGTDSGVLVDQPVIARQGVLVGKIVKVTSDSAMVRLLNDNQSRIAAMIVNHDKSMGAVEGGYRISLRMTLIPRDEAVVVGDQVVTSGLEEHIPRGLLIGNVAVIENEPYKPFQQAILRPAIDLEKLMMVSVLTSK